MSSGDGVVGVVVAAGRSTRFGGARPKQFEPLGGPTVLERSVLALSGHPDVRGVIVVLSPEEASGPRAADVLKIPGVLGIAPGGATRARSVLSGVRQQASSHVLVHDAARPLVPPAVVRAVVEATLRHGAAVPVVPVPDTVKEESAGFVARTLDRTLLRLAQTPQGARTDWLLDALAKADAAGVAPTDEAQALELAGYRVAVVPGDRDNRKITEPRDLEEARRSLDPGARALRVGTGFDVHRFEEGRPLVLGGVPFPGETGLAGHSDADVVLHAVMDAILGAIAAGDIGEHFPPGDPRFAGADSATLLRQVAGMAAAAGFSVVNLDVTVLAERPRLRPHADRMRARIADCLGIPAGRVSVKATTLERLGALGRAEGMACQAVALLAPREGS
jgi:2-C-methyl-D-erythritol 4-phosphate cytidylyltransferase/2-C-methyl-D-erythritol 2,4-cyclodiphosphate synthase